MPAIVGSFSGLSVRSVKIEAMSLTRWWAAVLCAGIAIGGCAGSGGPGHRRSAAALGSCPERVPRRPAGGRLGGQVVPPDPAGALVCTWVEGRAFGHTTLAVREAQGLAAVLDGGARRVRGACRPQTTTDTATLVRFVGPGRRATSVVVAPYPGETCRFNETDLAASSTGSALLDGAVSAAVEQLTEPAFLREPGSPPSLMGATVPSAVASAAKDHDRVLLFDGEAITNARPPGTIILQDPAAGTNSGPDTVIRVLIAEPPSARCHPGQLRLGYEGQQLGRQGETAPPAPGRPNNYASLLLADTSNSRCMLDGSLAVTGLDRSGRRVASTQIVLTGEPLILTAEAPTAVAARADAYAHTGGVIAELSLEQASATDLSPGSRCTPSRIVPYSWRITGAGGFSISGRNYGLVEEEIADQDYVPAHIATAAGGTILIRDGFYTCSGRFTAGGFTTVPSTPPPTGP
jgi:hypothetical protein